MVEDLGDEDFEIIVAETPKVEIDIPRDKLSSFIKLVEELGWNKTRLKRYISTALRLRDLERRYGKSYIALVRSYEKLTSEEVKLKYSIEQLLEKRRRMEEDLSLYMEQYNLTLEAVQNIGRLLEALRERGLDLGDLEKALNALSFMKESGYDVKRILERIRNIESYEESIGELERAIEELGKSLEELEEERNRLLKEVEEIHGISGGLEDLRRTREALEESIRQAEAELQETSNRLEEVRSELEAMLGHKASIEELRRDLESLKSEVERLRSEKESLQNEVSQLLGAKAEIEEIRKRMSEERERLMSLEREVQDRQSYLEILEGELAAAYSILKLFTDPEAVDAEDLEPLVVQLQRVLRIKRGELPALKPLEPHIMNRVKEDLVSLIMPQIRGEFVPRKVFEQLEREVKRLREEKEILEEELNSLRKILEARAPVQSPRPRLEAVDQNGEAIELKTLEQGRRFRIKCPFCGDVSVVVSPTSEELEELESAGYKLRFTCGCGRSFSIPPGVLLRKLEAGGE